MRKLPGIFLRFFRWYCKPSLVDFIEGDLLEVYKRRRVKDSKWKADFSFVMDVLLLFRPGIIKPFGFQTLSNTNMIFNYLKIGARNLYRFRFQTMVNTLGLALGICTSLIIYFIVAYEFSFDNFHPDKERIYRVLSEITETTGDKITFARTPSAIEKMGNEELTGIEVMCGIIPYNTTITIKQNTSSKTFESRKPGTNYITTGVVDPNFFKVFMRSWIIGNAQSVVRPNSIVLTESRMQQYFGELLPQEVIGKTIIIDDSLQLTVTGIVNDWEGNTDLNFTDFISFGTIENSFLKNRLNVSSWNIRGLSAWNFIRLEPDADPSSVEAQLKTIVTQNGDPGTKLKLLLEPLSDMHFNDHIIENPIRIAHKQTLYILIGIAMFILVMAAINFITMATAQSLQRIKEVSIRKTLGGGRSSISFQFLVETFLVTGLATTISLTLIHPILNTFENFLPDGLKYRFLDGNTLFAILMGIVVTTLLAGLYPALKLASYQPILGMKGVTVIDGHRSWNFRKSLTVFQFSISAIFIVGSLVIVSQLRYIEKKDLGFDPKSVLVVNTPWGTGPDKIEAFSNRIKQISAVETVASQWLSPMSDNPRGMKLKLKDSDEQDFWVTQIAGNENYIPLYKIQILAGRNLEPTDTVKELVINETLMKFIGVDQSIDAIGKILYWNDQPYPIVGVVADFHTHSLHQALTPLCIINRQDRQGGIAIKFGNESNIGDQAMLIEVEKQWKVLFPDSPFNYSFLEDSLDLLYKRDRQASTLINLCMSIAIFISCLGLFGLTHMITQRRSKEMSIRRVLGAEIRNLVSIISRDFIVQVVIAIAIASPVAWYLMQQWLSKFAYHTEIHLWVYIIAGLILTSITFITVGLITVKASLANPVKNLRSE